MKKIAVFILIALFVFVSCGKKENSAESKVVSDKQVGSSSENKKAVNEHIIVKITIGDQEKTFEDVDVRYDRMTDETILSGGYEEGETAGLQESTFQLSFKGKDKGDMEDASLTLKGYEVEEVAGTVDSLKTSKGPYGGTKIDSIKGTFNGTVKELDENGFPQGDPIPFEASFEK